MPSPPQSQPIEPRRSYSKTWSSFDGVFGITACSHPSGRMTPRRREQQGKRRCESPQTTGVSAIASPARQSYVLQAQQLRATTEPSSAHPCAMGSIKGIECVDQDSLANVHVRCVCCSTAMYGDSIEYEYPFPGVAHDGAPYEGCKPIAERPLFVHRPRLG